MAKKKVFLFRHGQTDWNLQSRFQGHTDIPLNETGRSQAAQLINPMRRLQVESIYTSDLMRTRETSGIIADALRISVQESSQLREAHLGEAEGLTYREILNRFGEDLVNRWRSSHPQHLDVAYPRGESGREVMSRVSVQLSEFLSTTSHQRVGVASHGGVIRRLVQMAAPHLEKPVPIPNGVVHCLEYDPMTGSWIFIDFFQSEI